MPTKEEAAHLEIATSLPVWEILRVGTSGGDGQPIEALTVRIEAAGRTHVGNVRRRNEDALHVGESLFTVADGLGGHVAGDIASTTAIDALRVYDRHVEPGDLVDTLGRAVPAANDALRRRIETEPEVAGLGTTFVAMLWSRTTAAIANVGDSRAYLLRGRGSPNSETKQLTEDHIYRHLVADAPDVPDLGARLTRFIDGRVDGRSPDITTYALRPSDRFLLCSDGLNAVAPHELLHAKLNGTAGPDDTAKQLIALAIYHGGPDNITALVVDVTASTA